MKRGTDKERWESIKPLAYYPNSAYADKYYLHYRKFEPLEGFDIYSLSDGKKVDLNDGQIIFGINAKSEEFTKLDFLRAPSSFDFIIHSRVKAIFDELCSNDFQAFKVKIKPLDPKKQGEFINEDYYLINILNLCEIIDQEKSTFLDLGDGVRLVKKKVFLPNSMEGHLLARDKYNRSAIYFHPSLARHFPKRSKGAQFLMDFECPI